MTTDLPETVQDAANKLISALALHEDTRATVTDALHDMWDAGREDTATTQPNEPAWWCVAHGRDACSADPEPSCRVCDIATTLRAIRSDARALRDGSALTRTTPASRIVARAEQLLAALGEKTGAELEEGQAS